MYTAVMNSRPGTATLLGAREPNDFVIIPTFSMSRSVCTENYVPLACKYNIRRCSFNSVRRRKTRKKKGTWCEDDDLFYKIVTAILLQARQRWSQTNNIHKTSRQLQRPVLVSQADCVFYNSGRGLNSSSCRREFGVHLIKQRRNSRHCCARCIFHRDSSKQWHTSISY